MKNKRIKLESLKVRSFITNIKESQNIAIMGGLDTFDRCPTTITTQDTNLVSCLQMGNTLDAYCMDN